MGYNNYRGRGGYRGRGNSRGRYRGNNRNYRGNNRSYRGNNYRNNTHRPNYQNRWNSSERNENRYQRIMRERNQDNSLHYLYNGLNRTMKEVLQDVKEKAKATANKTYSEEMYAKLATNCNSEEEISIKIKRLYLRKMKKLSTEKLHKSLRKAKESIIEDDKTKYISTVKNAQIVFNSMIECLKNSSIDTALQVINTTMNTEEYRNAKLNSIKLDIIMNNISKEFKLNTYNLQDKWVKLRMHNNCSIDQWVSNCKRVHGMLKESGHVISDFELHNKIIYHCLPEYSPKDVVSLKACDTIDKWIEYANSIYQINSMKTKTLYHNNQQDHQNNRRPYKHRKYEGSKYQEYQREQEEKSNEEQEAKSNDGYIPKEKWNKLTPEQKREIYKKRENVTTASSMEEKQASVRAMASAVAEILKIDIPRVQSEKKRTREETEQVDVPELKKAKKQE